MMQHSNLDNQLSGSSSFATPPSQSLGGSHQWNSIGLILNTDQFSLDATEVLPTTQTPNSSMVQDLGLQWPYSTEDYTHHSPHQVNFLENNIKEEPPGSLINFISRGKEPSDSSHQYQPLPCLDNLIKQEPLLNNQYSPAGFHTTASYGGFLPTTTGAGTPSFTSLLSNGGGFHGVNFLSPVGSNLSLSREIGGFGTHEPLQSQRDQRSSLVRGTKRSSSTASSSTVGSASPPPPPPPPSMAKKPRTESRSPISPFKVRKEKLGDRIAALQQLVAPFGKTDTASVLMEAIGYIKFLQEQVQKLSVPYMKSSSGNRQGTSHGVAGGEKDEESRQGLRSRGLCLVPLACTSYVTSEDLGIWPSQNPRGGF